VVLVHEINYLVVFFKANQTLHYHRETMNFYGSASITSNIVEILTRDVRAHYIFLNENALYKFTVYLLTYLLHPKERGLRDPCPFPPLCYCCIVYHGRPVWYRESKDHYVLQLFFHLPSAFRHRSINHSVNQEIVKVVYVKSCYHKDHTEKQLIYKKKTRI